MALPKEAYELRIRTALDELFDRDPIPGELATRFFAGEASWEEFCASWRPDWVVLISHNRFLYPMLLEKAPDFLTRIRLVGLVHEEYGGGDLEKSHAQMSRRFFAAIGATEEELYDAPDVENPTKSKYRALIELQSRSIDIVQAKLKSWTPCSWVEMLVNFLYAEVFAPPIFNRLIELAIERYGMSRDALAFFIHHAELDVSDADRAVELVAEHARTPEDQQRVLDMIDQWGRDPGGPWLARHPGTTSYRFVRNYHAQRAALTS